MIMEIMQARKASIIAIVVSLISVTNSSCKKLNNSNLQSLDNFAAQQTLRDNSCVGDGKSVKFQSLIDSVKISGGSADSRRAVRDSLAAVPAGLLNFFVLSEGVVNITNQPVASCSKGSSTDLANQAKYEKTHSCATQGIRKNFKANAQTVSKILPPIDIYITDDAAVIRHYLVRQFGLVFFGTYSRTAYLSEFKGYSVGSDVRVDIALAIEKLTVAYLLDIGHSPSMSMISVDAYLGRGAGQILRDYWIGKSAPRGVQPEMIMARAPEDVLTGFFKKIPREEILARFSLFKASLVSEAFDSYYCNAVAPFNEGVLKSAAASPSIETLTSAIRSTQNTWAVMKEVFPLTHRQFRDFAAPILDSMTSQISPFIAANAQSRLALADGTQPSDAQLAVTRNRMVENIRDYAIQRYRFEQASAEAAYLTSMRERARLYEPIGREVLTDYQKFDITRTAMDAALAGKDNFKNLDSATQRKMRDSLEITASPLAASNPFSSQLSGSRLRQDGLGNPFQFTASEQAEREVLLQRDVINGKYDDPAMMIPQLSAALGPRERLLVAKSLSGTGLSSEEMTEVRTIRERSDSAAKQSAQLLGDVDRAFQDEMKNFKANSNSFLPNIQRMQQENTDAAMRSLIEERYQELRASADPGIRDQLFDAKNGDPVDQIMNKIQTENPIDYAKAGIPASNFEQAAERLVLSGYGGAVDYRASNNRKSPGSGVDYVKDSEYTVGKYLQGTQKYFPDLKFEDAITQDKRMAAEASKEIWEAPANAYQDRLRITSAGIQGTGLASLATPAGPVAAPFATAVSTGLDASNATISTVRAGLGSETARANIAGDYFSAISPVNVGTTMKAVGTTQRALQTSRHLNQLAVPLAKTAIGTAGNVYNYEQLRQGGIGLGELGYFKMNEQQILKQREIQQQLQNASTVDEQLKSVDDVFGRNNYVRIPFAGDADAGTAAAVFAGSQKYFPTPDSAAQIAEQVIQPPTVTEPQAESAPQQEANAPVAESSATGTN